MVMVSKLNVYPDQTKGSLIIPGLDLFWSKWSNIMYRYDWLLELRLASHPRRNHVFVLSKDNSMYTEFD
jgi:hypothetical protein